jgi:hypothetical protein
VVSSVAAPIRGAAFGADAANDVPARCEVNSFGIDDVVSAVAPATGGAALALAAISLEYDEDGPASPRLADNAEPALEGLGLGIGIAKAGAGRAVLVGAATCCVG